MTQQQSTTVGDLQRAGEPTKSPLATLSHFMDRFSRSLRWRSPST